MPRNEDNCPSARLDTVLMTKLCKINVLRNPCVLRSGAIVFRCQEEAEMEATSGGIIRGSLLHFVENNSKETQSFQGRHYTVSLTSELLSAG
jgi:hypothetical protein